MKSLAWVLAMWMAAPAGAVSAAEPITKTEARRMSLEKTKRRVLDQLGDVLVENTRPTGRKPTRPLSDLTFRTIPRSTDKRGLCAYDVVTILFRPTNDQDLGADLPVRANGVVASTRYGLLKDVDAIEAYDDADPRPADDRACRALDPDHYFNAPDEIRAIEGARWFRSTITAASDPAVKVSCRTGVLRTDEACRALVTGLKLSHAWDIAESRVGTDACWTFTLGAYDLRACGPAGGSKVVRIEAEEQILLVHERVD